MSSALSFSCTGARPEQYAASPTMLFDLTIRESTGVRVHAALLRAQLRIEPHRRRYSAEEAEGVHDMFGEVSRWGDTLKPIQLAMATLLTPAFTGELQIPLPVSFSYDIEVACNKYLNAMRDGEIPILMLFSGSVFYQTDNGVQIDPVAWHEEANFRLPVAVWREMMDLHFPGQGWIQMRTDTIDALRRYRAKQADLTWDHTMERLLKDAGEPT
ncbi:MAG TPA: DUF6084 family protein [Cryptosporangiaceae bacterium]|nr:DUF6084 family protein [Cryptosporangiaceae bacterium]